MAIQLIAKRTAHCAAGSTDTQKPSFASRLDLSILDLISLSAGLSKTFDIKHEGISGIWNVRTDRSRRVVNGSISFLGTVSAKRARQSGVRRANRTMPTEFLIESRRVWSRKRG